MKPSRFVYILLFLLSVLSYGQTATKKVALVYDVSYGMQSKDLAKEMVYLDSYFNQNPEIQLALKTFSNTIILESSYSIQNGDWSQLQQELSNTIYDGGSNFEGILPNNVDEILFVTDGLSTKDNLPKSFGVPVNVISSTPKVNENQLRDLALGSGGIFINVTNLNLELAQEDSDIITITGVVSDAMGPLSEVAVYSPETKSSEITDTHGEYAIVSKKGGSLEFSYIGKKAVVTSVPISGVKNIRLTDVNEVLDEVVLTAASEVEEELVNTGNQMVDKKRLGYGIETIKDKDISEQDIDLETAIQGQFSNINLKSDQNISEFLSRGAGMSILLDQTGLVVIDGVPMNSDKGALSGINTPSNGAGTLPDKSIMNKMGALDPVNIASVTVLKGLAATNKWGTLGRNGVILITTKNGLAYKGDQKKEVVLGTTATYDGTAQATALLPNTSYIKALQATTTIDQAYEVYLEQRKTFGSDASYYLDVASYFKNWNNPFMLERILSNVNEITTSLEDLRALGYKYQEFGFSEQAVATYERIKNLNPSNAQAHRNLALAYVQNGKIKEALAIYQAFDKNAIGQVSDFGTLRKTMVAEFKNLVARNNAIIKTDNIDSFYLNNLTYSTRVIFEWSDFDAVFDLQIVNPQKRFFTWSHTPQAEAARMRQEQALGYGLEEFFMTAADQGEWLFNITYYGKNAGDTSKPTYLKITTINNFGKANQREQVRVVSLLEEGNLKTILKLDLK